jgi:hypothetical protein
MALSLTSADWFYVLRRKPISATSEMMGEKAEDQQ